MDRWTKWMTLQVGGKKAGSVPVAVIRWGCTPKEEVYRGTLGTIAEVTAGRELSPCIMVVGEVAAMGGGGGGDGSGGGDGDDGGDGDGDSGDGIDGDGTAPTRA